MGCLCRLGQDSNVQDAQTTQPHQYSVCPAELGTAYDRLFYAHDSYSFVLLLRRIGSVRRLKAMQDAVSVPLAVISG